MFKNKKVKIIFLTSIFLFSTFLTSFTIYYLVKNTRSKYKILSNSDVFYSLNYENLEKNTEFRNEINIFLSEHLYSNNEDFFASDSFKFGSIQDLTEVYLSCLKNKIDTSFLRGYYSDINFDNLNKPESIYQLILYFFFNGINDKAEKKALSFFDSFWDSKKNFFIFSKNYDDGFNLLLSYLFFSYFLEMEYTKFFQRYPVNINFEKEILSKSTFDFEKDIDVYLVYYLSKIKKVDFLKKNLEKIKSAADNETDRYLNISDLKKFKMYSFLYEVLKKFSDSEKFLQLKNKLKKWSKLSYFNKISYLTFDDWNITNSEKYKTKELIMSNIKKEGIFKYNSFFYSLILFKNKNDFFSKSIKYFEKKITQLQQNTEEKLLILDCEDVFYITNIFKNFIPEKLKKFRNFLLNQLILSIKSLSNSKNFYFYSQSLSMLAEENLKINEKFVININEIEEKIKNSSEEFSFMDLIYFLSGLYSFNSDLISNKKEMEKILGALSEKKYVFSDKFNYYFVYKKFLKKFPNFVPKNLILKNIFSKKSTFREYYFDAVFLQKNS